MDITFEFGVSKSSFFSNDVRNGVVWPILEAIDQLLTIGLPIKDPEKLHEMSLKFSAFTHGEMKGCVTAVDGWVAKTRKPFLTEYLYRFRLFQFA